MKKIDVPIYAVDVRLYLQKQFPSVKSVLTAIANFRNWPEWKKQGARDRFGTKFYEDLEPIKDLEAYLHKVYPEEEIDIENLIDVTTRKRRLEKEIMTLYQRINKMEEEIVDLYREP